MNVTLFPNGWQIINPSYEIVKKSSVDNILHEYLVIIKQAILLHFHLDLSGAFGVPVHW
jgi:hypothetical protein